MVFLPLLYPEIFERFKMALPRGCSYGAPGTGKTLIARALAASCSRAGSEVSFFMRKVPMCFQNGSVNPKDSSIVV